jgi:hypothetical protein
VQWTGRGRTLPAELRLGGGKGSAGMTMTVSGLTVCRRMSWISCANRIKNGRENGGGMGGGGTGAWQVERRAPWDSCASAPCMDRGCGRNEDADRGGGGKGSAGMTMTVSGLTVCRRMS